MIFADGHSQQDQKDGYRIQSPRLQNAVLRARTAFCGPVRRPCCSTAGLGDGCRRTPPIAASGVVRTRVVAAPEAADLLALLSDRRMTNPSIERRI
jgi:hypothetical protein